jgi:tetratricopeptide (TPR) repeat protein
VAEGYFLAGRFKEAEELCRAGLAKYPHYSTARIVLGKCLAETGRGDEGLESLRGVLRSYPDSGIVRQLIEEIEAKNSQTKPDVIAQVEVVVPEPVAGPVAAVESSPKVEIAPIVEVPIVVEPIALPEVPVLARLTPQRLERPSVAVEIVVEPPKVGSSEVVDDGRIVSKTLAEIYAGQGAYEEAILTYKLLKGKRPAEAVEIEKRIAELKRETLSSKP